MTLLFRIAIFKQFLTEISENCFGILLLFLNDASFYGCRSIGDNLN